LFCFSQGSFQQPAPTPSSSPVPYVQNPGTSAAAGLVASTSVALTGLTLGDEQRKAMILQFSAESGMNAEGSKTYVEH